MNEPEDLSSAIAWCQARIVALKWMEPDGKWKESHLLQQWLRDSYSLNSLAEFRQLGGELLQEQKQAHDRYLRRKLAGHGKEASRIQLELPGVRYDS